MNKQTSNQNVDYNVWQWSYNIVVSNQIDEDLGNYTAYGIQLLKTYDNIHIVCNTILDISSEKCFIEKMIKDFNKYQLSPLHFSCAVEDYINNFF